MSQILTQIYKCDGLYGGSGLIGRGMFIEYVSTSSHTTVHAYKVGCGIIIVTYPPTTPTVQNLTFESIFIYLAHIYIFGPDILHIFTYLVQIYNPALNI